MVSILTRPVGRMLPRVRVDELGRIGVSILTRPVGRMLRASRSPRCMGTKCFNPHPARRPDATRCPCTVRLPRTRFNPHPARRPDATRGRHPPRGHPVRVSILTRPVGRMLRRIRRTDPVAAHVSILTRPVGRMLPTAPACRPRRRSRFNPHPARRPDATCWLAFSSSAGPRFNPHPARRPDATRSTGP